METSPADNRYKHLSWGPLAAVFGSIIFYIGAQFLAGILIFVALLLASWDLSRIGSWLGGGGTAQFVFSTVAAVTILGFVFMFLHSRRAHPRDLGLVRPRLRDIGYLFIGLGLYIILYIVIVSALARLLPGLNTDQTQDLGFSRDAAGNALLMVFVALVVLPPIVEEVVIRGFLFSGLRRGFSFWPAAVISSLLFGLAHLLGGEGGTTIWIAAIDTFILAMVLAYLRERTGSLWAPIGLHGLKNLTAFLFLFVFKIA